MANERISKSRQSSGEVRGKTYGRNFKGLIHVHHIKEISSIGEEYIIDPINDLIPVCPNCHAALHHKRPAYTVEHLIDILKNKGME